MLTYYRKNEDDTIIDVIYINDEVDVNKWINDNYSYTDKKIIPLSDGTYVFEEDFDSDQEEIKQKTLELETAKKTKLKEVDNWIAIAITSGFKSKAGGEKAVFDSTETDQQNLQIMLNASKSKDFETDPTYQGRIPIRGIPDGTEEKKVYSMDAAQMQLLNDDLARHIGSSKIVGWTLQEMVKTATSKEDVEAITWEDGVMAAQSINLTNN